jgi:signal transduction histidine kinase
MPVSIRVVLLLLFFSFSRGAHLLAQPGETRFYLYEDTSRYPDPQRVLQLYRNHQMKQAPDKGKNIGFTHSLYWLLYENPVDRPADSMLLYIGHHHINRIHVYFTSDDSTRLQWTTGDYYPFRQRPVDATGFYFPINRKGIYLTQIDKRNESLQLSYYLTDKEHALREESGTKTTIFLFTGMLLLLIIFGMYLFIIEKDRLYLYYILYIGSGWLWVLANAGYGFEYLWPDLPWFASKSRPMFVVVPLIFASAFLVRYIGGVKSKLLINTLRVINILLAGCMVLILCLDDQDRLNNWWLYLQYLVPILPLTYVVLSFIILIAASYRGNRLAVFYLVSQSVLLISVVLQASFALGSLNRFDRFFSHYGLAFGYVVEAIILTAGLVYRFNRYRLDKEQLLLEMNQRQLENTRVLMQVQQEERSRIANQLHDVAGSLLSAVKLNLSSLREKIPFLQPEATVKFEKTEEAVGIVSDMVRNLSHALSPVMLTQVGFRTALEKLVSIFNASGKINMQLVVIGFDRYEAKLEQQYMTLYSIAYELLNNIAKHSGARHALLQVSEHETVFSLIAEDDGVGLEPMSTAGDGLGLAGIRSKTNYYGGVMAIDRNEPRGLIVTIEIPITYDTKQDHIG